MNDKIVRRIRVIKNVKIVPRNANPNQIGEEVTDLRSAIRRCGMSQCKLAEKSGVPQQRISRFLQGKDIRLKTAEKLCAVLGIRFQENPMTCDHGKEIKPTDPIPKSLYKRVRGDDGNESLVAFGRQCSCGHRDTDEAVLKKYEGKSCDRHRNQIGEEVKISTIAPKELRNTLVRLFRDKRELTVDSDNTLVAIKEENVVERIIIDGVPPWGPNHANASQYLEDISAFVWELHWLQDSHDTIANRLRVYERCPACDKPLVLCRCKAEAAT